MTSSDFRSLNLSEALLRVLTEMNYVEMTAIQAASIPPLLAGQDLVGQSKTGSGKTAAFVLPILQKIRIRENIPQALILCPTRELCDQVLREALKFSKYIPQLQIVSLVGGQAYPAQEAALKKGVQLIVGTPGRTLEHLNSGKLNPNQLGILVLDEADRLLQEGFAAEMTALIEKLPKKRQTIFFSATFPESMEELSRLHQNSAQRITINEAAPSSLAIEQFVYDFEKPQKIEALMRILQNHPSMCTLIFCRTKASVDEIGKLLAKAKASSQILHADLKQADRDRATALFRNGSLRILVATDVAARGLDIDTLELVINFDLPPSPEIYIHRIGRTGRMGRKGTAVSIATAYEAELVNEIQKVTGVTMIRKDLNASGDGSQIDFQKTIMRTIQISSGKAEKLSAEEIMTALKSGSQTLLATEIGIIEIHDHFSWVAIKPPVAEKALHKLRNSKFKGAAYKASLICKLSI